MTFGLGIGLGITIGGNGSGGQGGLPLVASLVGFGDSITVGQAASDAAHQWLDIVSAALGAGTPLNKGIAGTVLQNSNDSGGAPRTDNGRDRYAADLLGANQREMAIIAYGFNDARYTGAPSTFNLAQYAVDYREILTGLIAGGYSEDRLCILSPYWISDTGLTTGSAGFTGQTRAVFEQFVAAAKAVAKEFGVYYADTYAAMRDNGGASLISGDFIHPTDAGHAVIASTALAATLQTSDVPSNLFFSDEFIDPSGTLLANHTGEKAASWVAVSGSGGTIDSDTRFWASTSTAVYRSLIAAPQADYYVEGIFDYLSTVASDNVAVAGRMSSAAVTYYWFGYSRASAGYRLFKTVAGVNTQLGSTVAGTFDSGSQTMRLEMTGTTIRGLVNGVEVISQTDSAIAGAGSPGIRYGVTQTSTTGIHLNTLRAGIL